MQKRAKLSSRMRVQLKEAAIETSGGCVLQTENREGKLLYPTKPMRVFLETIRVMPISDN